ncbi:MAG: hypothetical protein A2049_08815 [Elusimicrobia bacterium GWA2_62_23]|nr:MAG: hypothetical protein A2049_08815 [Elusimicrobia bacterium GWA2_62_23]
MKKLLPLTLLLLAGCAGREYNPALALWRHYEPAAAAHAVNPYLNNVIGLGLLQKRSHVEETGAYIQWYIDHLNYPDKHGVTGSMYDYYIGPDGRETAGKGYDSVDSYAATFLILLEKYYSVSGDARLVRRNWGKIKDVAFIISYLQDKDGLVRALPGSDSKYLMDNCECYAGLLAYQRLAEALGYGRQPYYDTVAQAIKKGITEVLYDRAGGFYYWGLAGGVKSGHRPETLYPDALAQIFPALYGVTEDPKPLEDFLSRYGSGAGLPPEQRLILRLAEAKAGK